MSLAVWPPIGPEQLKAGEAETARRELAWITSETMAICQELKHGLDDCYALVAPIDPGCTLVMSTPRNEKIKGTMTRVGTRIVKGTLSLQLRTLPAQTVVVSPSSPIHVHALAALHTHLTQSIDLLVLTLSRDPPPDAASLASTFALISDSLAQSASLLKGPSLMQPDTSWLSASCPPHHFSPPLPPNISLHISLQESSVVLWLRALEPADVPLQFGTKLGLAIGTVRRLEHDEMDLVFRYRHRADANGEENVYVREKVRVESADPSLISLYSKLGYLNHMLGQARSNLAAVMSVELDEQRRVV